MNSQQFITKQRRKYYWKALRYTTTMRPLAVRRPEAGYADTFWEYEQTPRTTVS